MIVCVVGIPDDVGFIEGTIGGVVVRKFFFRDFSFRILIVGVGFGVIGVFEEFFWFGRSGYAFSVLLSLE
jgi:hypothetical protein